ncbi:16S rRNA (adenine(1518)-N(6)/adenine(1519)-N(6))-dimethyltransferaseRsmA [soil metagenome]
MTVRHLDRQQLRRHASEADFHPSSSLGQHFLHDAVTARRIVATCGVRRHDHVLDIGAGLGSLTLGLLAKGAHVTAVELDPLLAKRLPTVVAEHTHSEIHRLTVLNHDVLALRSSDLIAQPTVAVLNIPNTIATTAELHLLAEFPSIRTVVAVMDSLEAGQRLTGEPGDAKCSAEGAKVRFFGTVSRHGAVAPVAWWPTPRSYHTVVRIDRYKQPLSTHDSTLRTTVFELIDIAFAQRRKSARTAFADWAGSGSESARRLLAASIDPARRADSLGILDFIRLQQRAGGAHDARSRTRSPAIA